MSMRVKQNSSSAGSPCDFTVHVERYSRYITNSGHIDVITVHCKLADGTSTKSFSFTLKELSSFDWREQCPAARFDVNRSTAFVQRYLADQVRQQLGEPEVIFLMEKRGFQTVQNERIFCAGKDIFRAPCSETALPKIESRMDGPNLDADSNVEEKDAAEYFYGLLSLSPNTFLGLSAYVICYLLYPLYEEIGRPPQFCLFLYGQTGTQKTTVASFFTQLYNRGNGIQRPPRLNASTSAAAKILCNARDEVVVLDDLFPHADSDLRKQQEKTFLEVLRYVGDGTVPARSRGSEVSQQEVRCGVLFTGEYRIGTGSDAARFLSIEMKQPDLQLLKQYQERPLMLSTFYQFFIQWILENYDDVVEFLRDHYNFYSAEVTSGVHTRLKEMHFFLRSAYLVFLAYCLAKSYLLADDIVEADRYFCNLLTQIIDQQDQLVRQDACGKLKSETNYTMHFRQLCQNRAFHIADCLEDFNESKHDGLLYKGKLCLRGKCLKRLYPNGSLQAAINQWRRDGILETGGQNPTKQIFSLGGKRFFFFLLEHLE
mgnify:FL=1